MKKKILAMLLSVSILLENGVIVSAANEAGTAENESSRQWEEVSWGKTENGLGYDTWVRGEEKKARIVYCYEETEEVIIPDEIEGYPVREVIDDVFIDKKNIRKVVFPKSVETIGYECFRGCSNLEEVVMEGVRGFYGSSMGGGTDNFFYECDNLKRLTIGDHCNFKIEEAQWGGDTTFLRRSVIDNLEYIYLGNEMPEVSLRIFYGKSLKEIEIGPQNAFYRSVNNVVYDKSQNALLVAPTSYAGDTYEIPYGTKALLKAGFQDCSNIKKICIPQTVTEIEYPFAGISPVLYVVQGSYAETYAKEEQRPYQYFGVYFKETQQELLRGERKQNEVVNETGKKLQWSSSNPQIVSVDEDGTMQALETGKAVITVTDGAQYSVSCEVNVAGNIANAELSEIEAQTYTGKKLCPAVQVLCEGKLLQENKDYKISYQNNINAGLGEITVTGIGNYTGSVNRTFAIAPKPFEKGNIALSKTNYTYNGKAQKPSVTIKDSKGKKIASSNYAVTYSSGRKNVGTYTVTIKFKNNYTGTVKKTFTIQPKGTSLASVSAKSKGFTAKWKKQSTQTTGYEIQYSTDGKFKKGNKIQDVKKNQTTSQNVTKLKAKKKYYVRIRTYKTVKVSGKSKKIYSDWSKAKTVTTKK